MVSLFHKNPTSGKAPAPKQMAEKWHKNGRVDAGDRKSGTCYTDIVCKWASQGLLIFLQERGTA